MDRIERIAKIIVSSSYRWIQLPDFDNCKRYVFLDAKQNPIYYVKGGSGNLFHVIKIDYLNVYNIDSNKKNALRMLTGALSRSGDLDELKKSSGYDCVKWEGDLKTEKIAAKLLNELGMTLPDFQNLFKKTDFSENDEKSSLLTESDFRRWRVVFEKGTIDRNEAFSLLTSVEGYCGKLAKDICYGIVEVKNDLPPKVLADYSSENDSMRIKSSFSQSQMLFSFIHELGHRCWYHAISKKGRALVRSKFNEMKQKKKVFVKIPISSSNIVFKDGTSAMIRWDIEKNSFSSTFNAIPEGSHYVFGKTYNIENYFEAEEIRSIDGELYDDGRDTFPSDYSKSSCEEFFAECFAFWRVGELCGTLSSFFEKLFNDYMN